MMAEKYAVRNLRLCTKTACVFTSVPLGPRIRRTASLIRKSASDAALCRSLSVLGHFYGSQDPSCAAAQGGEGSGSPAGVWYRARRKPRALLLSCRML